MDQDGTQPSSPRKAKTALHVAKMRRIVRPTGVKTARRMCAVACAALVLLVPGVAPATVQEQRARLPPPATCDDPVEGIWKSHKYDPRFEDWYIFTLRIKRVKGSETRLEGTVQAHSWTGRPNDSEPPVCRPGLLHWKVAMTAEGTINDRKIGFRGTSWRLENVLCGMGPGRGEYNLDNFSGTIDPELQEFQSVNNDGGRSVNDPTVFRRVSCLDAPSAPHVRATPPPFYPAKRGGCGLF